MSQLLYGLTIEDIQKILENTASNGRKVGNGLLFLDANYLYNFRVQDMTIVSKYNMLGRYDIRAVKEWHNACERWYNDQTVSLGFDIASTTNIKPIKIVRKFDRIVNEGLELVAKMLLGESGTLFKYHAIGEGDAEEALPSDTAMVDQISRIDVTKASDGGSLSRDGSTIYIVGMHPASLGSASITETGVFNHSDPTKDLMLDHTVFPTPIVHDQFEDSAGSTTIIYMCGV